MDTRKVIVPSASENAVTIDDFPKTVYLEKDFRSYLFCICYYESGESLGSIAVSLGYPKVPGVNGRARDMWLGRKGIPRHRIEKLKKLSGISLNDLYNHIVPKENNVLICDWAQVYTRFKRNQQPGGATRARWADHQVTRLGSDEKVDTST
jgi:hypothetical protein